MEIITYKQHLFLNNLHTNLNTCPTVSQVPGKLRRKILLVAVGTTRRALLFQPHHRQERVLPKDDVLKGQTSGNRSGRGLGCKVDVSLWISFAFIFLAHKKRTTPRCSIVVHVLRGAAIL
jgi:hypothetical protein